MSTPIQQQAYKLQDAIYRDKYYTSLYEKALGKHNMSTASIDQCEFSDQQLVSMFNTFYFALPDSPVIRCGPFFALCDFCEHMFDNQPDDE